MPRNILNSSNSFLTKLAATTDFIVALSTDIDTEDEAVLAAVQDTYHEVSRYALQKASTNFLKGYLIDNGLWYIKSVGYYEGHKNPNSYLIIAPKNIAEELTSHHADWFGQDSVIAFGPDCTMNTDDKPFDYATKVGNIWISFNLDGTVLEAYVDEGTLLLEASDNISSPWTEDQIVDIAYNVAGKVYYRYNWNGLDYTVDDFKQDMVLRILDAYRTGYMKLDERNPYNLIYSLINGWYAKNARQTKYKELSRKPVSLDVDMPEQGKKRYVTDTYVDSVQSKDLPQDEVDRANAIIDSIVGELSPLNFKTRKHNYVGHDNILGTIGLSEQTLARLYLRGITLHGILKIFDSDVANIGSSSTASYILHKLKEVINKVTDIINKLSKDDKAALIKYLETLS